MAKKKIVKKTIKTTKDKANDGAILKPLGKIGNLVMRK